MKFQHTLSAVRNAGPTTALRDHDMQWDFWTLSPESAHQVTYLMGDRGVPKKLARNERLRQSYLHAHQRGGGERFWVKWHFHTDLGDGNAHLTQDEADKMAGQDGDYSSPRPV